MRRRSALAVVLAIPVTVSLFLLMQWLIASPSGGLDETQRNRVIEFVRIKRSSDMELKRRQLPQKPQSKQQPEPPPLQLDSARGETGGHTINIGSPASDHDFQLSRLNLGAFSSDRQTVPIVRVRPMYPPQAAQRRIEGWVQVEFSISETGAVKNPVVVAAQPPGVFNKAALRAIRKWKYKPKIENGVAVKTLGIKVKISFNLDDL